MCHLVCAFMANSENNKIFFHPFWYEYLKIGNVIKTRWHFYNYLWKPEVRIEIIFLKQMGPYNWSWILANRLLQRFLHFLLNYSFSNAHGDVENAFLLIVFSVCVRDCECICICAHRYVNLNWILYLFGPLYNKKNIILFCYFSCS